MNKHSEVEAKFRANHVTVPEIWKYLGDLSARWPSLVWIEGFKAINGTDVYYRQGDSVMRHRYDSEAELSTLTVKQRKSADSIADRHEIDLPMADEVEPNDVVAFLRMTGWKEEFSIYKLSWIWHIRRGETLVTIALYDVIPGAIARDRFLEIEVEKSNDHDPETSLNILNEWIPRLQEALKLEAPLNQSLYEMYRQATT